MFMKYMSVKSQQQGVKAETRFDDIVKHKIHDKNIFLEIINNNHLWPLVAS